MTPVTLDQVEHLEDEWRAAHRKARASGRPYQAPSRPWEAEWVAWERLADAKISLGVCCEPGCRTSTVPLFAWCKEHQS